MRAKTHVEDLDKGNRQALIIDELPYQVNKRTLLEKIASWSTKSASKASPTCGTSPTSPACGW